MGAGCRGGGGGKLLESCMEIARNIIQRSPLAVSLAKQAITEGKELSQAEGLQLEAELFAKAFLLKTKQKASMPLSKNANLNSQASSIHTVLFNTSN